MSWKEPGMMLTTSNIENVYDTKSNVHQYMHVTSTSKHPIIHRPVFILHPFTDSLNYGPHSLNLQALSPTPLFCSAVQSPARSLDPALVPYCWHMQALQFIHSVLEFSNLFTLCIHHLSGEHAWPGLNWIHHASGIAHAKYIFTHGVMVQAHHLYVLCIRNMYDKLLTGWS